ncbi:MAG: TM2 domain-containing protein [Bacteroidales bacterium]|nr:TM2 domain-containing protein [Bacteroidales bacterium]
MKRKSMFILAVVCIAIANSAFGQNVTEFRDVVYLKNGSIIKGQIVEQVFDSIIKIQTTDGSLFVYRQAEVEKIESEVQPAVPYYLYKSPATSWALSFFLVPGIGQFYNGDNTKGWLYLGGYVGSWLVFYAGVAQVFGDSYSDYTLNDLATTIGMISVTTLWFASWITAPKQARQLNRERGLLSWQIGKKSNLALSPDVKLYNNILPTQNVSSTFGMKVSINF